MSSFVFGNDSVPLLMWLLFFCKSNEDLHATANMPTHTHGFNEATKQQTKTQHEVKNLGKGKGKGKQAWAQQAWAEPWWQQQAWAEQAWAQQAWAEHSWQQQAWAEPEDPWASWTPGQAAASTAVRETSEHDKQD